MVAPYALCEAGVKSLDRWRSAVSRLEVCKSDLNSAHGELMNSVIELGDFLTPKDAKEDEVFNVLLGDEILAVKKRGGHNYVIGWREKPTRLEV